jgi:hypothetical protein
MMGATGRWGTGKCSPSTPGGADLWHDGNRMTAQIVMARKGRRRAWFMALKRRTPDLMDSPYARSQAVQSRLSPGMWAPEGVRHVLC